MRSPQGSCGMLDVAFAALANDFCLFFRFGGSCSAPQVARSMIDYIKPTSEMNSILILIL